MAGIDRRHFLQRGGLLLAGSGGLGFLGSLPRVRAEDMRMGGDRVRLRPEIEPLVRLLEDSPRERLLEEVAQRIRSGTPYRDVLAAVMLAGVRNIQPRPVGFKFHAVLVVNSAHLASLNAPESDRWLPLFWSLDKFKDSQEQDVREGDWTMAELEVGALPKPSRAMAAFEAAMDGWDESAADVAIAALVRSEGAQRIFDAMCRYGARDYRDIGHKAIYVANSWRTLQVIGWHHAEPVLRSLAYALLMHRGESRPSERDALADRPGRRNGERLTTIRADWLDGSDDPQATAAMLEALRSADWDESARLAVELLNRGASPESLWDAAHQHAAELMIRRPGIVSLHACTTTNALRYSFGQCGVDETRRFLLLQNLSFLTLFRDDARANDGMRIGDLEPEPGKPGLESVFDGLENDRPGAARRALAFLEGGGSDGEFVAAAQRWIYLKGRDSHDYKFSSSVLEDARKLSPEFRNRFLAASVFWLKGSQLPDSPLVARTRAALG